MGREDRAYFTHKRALNDATTLGVVLQMNRPATPELLQALEA